MLRKGWPHDPAKLPGKWSHDPANWHIASLLPKGSFSPTFHIQCQHAVRPVRDDLPHFKGFPASFGGSDEKVTW
jgi:hypothetical protein